MTFCISLYVLIVYNILCCDSPLGSRPGTTAGILIALFFVFIFILGCGVYYRQSRKSEQISWEQQCNNISHLPQGLEQPLESWWEWVWPSEFCSSLLVHILWHLMERSLSTKAAINQELPQDQYKADFFFKFRFAWLLFLFLLMILFGAWTQKFCNMSLNGQRTCLLCMLCGCSSAQSCSFKNALSCQLSLKLH